MGRRPGTTGRVRSRRSGPPDRVRSCRLTASSEPASGGGAVALFCLVHGAWHDASCWAPLVTALSPRGHESITPVLPLERAEADFQDYAEVVVDRLRGHDAPVLVGHSMSSAVIALVAARRPVRQLVYLCPAMAGFRAPPG